MDTFNTYQIFHKNMFFSGETNPIKFVYDDGSIHDIPEYDLFLTIALFSSRDHIGYVDVQKDDKIQSINRQEINPYFLEYSFFDNVQKNKINSYSDLTPTMIDFLRSTNPDVSNLSDEDMYIWFELYGINTLTLSEELSKQEIVYNNIYSKSNVFLIDINK